MNWVLKIDKQFSLDSPRMNDTPGKGNRMLENRAERARTCRCSCSLGLMESLREDEDSG